MKQDVSLMKISDLYFIKIKTRFYKKEFAMCIEDFKIVIQNNVKHFNSDCTHAQWQNLYDIYLNEFKKERPSYGLTALGFYTKTNTNKEYYISRYWTETAATTMIKNRQRRNFSEETKEKMRKSWQKNRQKNIESIKSGSVLCRNFYKKHYPEMSDIEISLTISTEQSKRSNKMYNRLKNEGKKKITNVSIEHFLDMGLSLQDAICEQSKRQATCGIERFVERYGLEDGITRYKERIIKWQQSLNNKSDVEKLDILKRKLYRTNFYSKASYNFFEKIVNILDSKGIELSYKYGEREYYVWDKTSNRIYFYDFYIKELNYAIEYNGHIWHPNKNELTNNEWLAWKNPITKQNAECAYAFDLYKLNLLNMRNITYDIVWDTSCMADEINKLSTKIIQLYEHYKKNQN